jgi:betaine-aldehyde dehydrogenase
MSHENHTFYLWINGQKVAGSEGRTFWVTNPATEEPVYEVHEATLNDVERAVQAAKTAFLDGRWSKLPLAERQARLNRFADLLEAHQDEIVEAESRQSGKPVKLVRYSDFPFSVDNLRYFAGQLRALEGQAQAEYNGAHSSWIRREPVGVVAGIAPWNYPIMMAIWKLAPALAAGNTMILKPASITPVTALMLGPIAQEAGIPDGVLNIIAGPGRIIGQALVEHPDVAMISLTGDTATGRQIMAAGAHRVKRLHLELGGKAPAIVLDDANLEAAIRGIAVGSLVNSGQDCTAATRAYVHRSRYQDFLDGIAQVYREVRLGDPLNLSTDLGPVVSQAQWQKIDSYVTNAATMGGRIVLGGGRPEHLPRGHYYQPTLITDVEQHWPIVQEEVFGPVLVVLPFDTDAEALAKANDVDYGLASSVWTENLRRGLWFSRELQFGEVWLNDHLPLTSEMPHGGVKQSGFGHDLSRYSLDEYTTVKHVMADMDNETVKGWHFTILGDVPE